MSHKARVRSQFSAAAPTYDAHAIVQGHAFAHLMSLVAGTPRTILDIGCGTGTHTCQLAERFLDARVTGLDIAPGMIAVASAQASPKSVIWAVGDAETQLPSSGYDLIVANAALHWFDDLPTALPRIASALSPSGQWVFTLFGADTFQELRMALGLVLDAPVPLVSDDFSTLDQVRPGVLPLFQSVTVTQQFIRIRYQSVMDVLRAIKRTGTRGFAIVDRLWTPRFLHALERAYRARYGQIWVSHQVFYVDCRHPRL